MLRIRHNAGFNLTVAVLASGIRGRIQPVYILQYNRGYRIQTVIQPVGIYGTAVQPVQ